MTALKFIVMVVQSMEIEVALPITVYVGNVRAILYVNKHITSDQMKHMDKLSFNA